MQRSTFTDFVISALDDVVDDIHMLQEILRADDGTTNPIKIQYKLLTPQKKMTTISGLVDTAISLNMVQISEPTENT